MLSLSLSEIKCYAIPVFDVYKWWFVCKWMLPFTYWGHCLTRQLLPLCPGNMAQEVWGDAKMPSTWDDYDAYVRHKLDPFQANMSEMAVQLYGHDVSTVWRQRTTLETDLLVLTLLTPLGINCAISLSISLHHVILSYPLFLLPCEFHLKCLSCDVVSCFPVVGGPSSYF